MLLHVGGSRERLEAAISDQVPLHEVPDSCRILVEVPGDATIWFGDNILESWQARGQTWGAASLTGTGLRLGSTRVESRTKLGRRWRVDLITRETRSAANELGAAVSLVQTWFPPRLGGAFWYRDASGRQRTWRAPQDVVTFIVDNGPTIRELLKDLERTRPTKKDRERRIASFGHPVDIEATRRLLSRRPELLVEHNQGSISVDGKTFNPCQVVLVRPVGTDVTTENRRLTTFLQFLLSDVLEALHVFSRDVTLVKSEAVALKASTLNGFLRSVPLDRRVPGPLEPRTAVERTDARYRLLADLRDLYYGEFGGAVRDESAWRRHVPSSHEIYQAFCAHAVARSFSLQPTSAWRNGTSRSRDAVFCSEEWELYYDSPSPPMLSWRERSGMPDGYRPDLVLRHRRLDRVILADAKYSKTDDGGISGERVKEVQAYLNAYGIVSAALLYPGGGSPVDQWTDIAGKGNLLRLIPLLPSPEDDDRLKRALTGIVCQPGRWISS